MDSPHHSGSTYRPAGRLPQSRLCCFTSVRSTTTTHRINSNPQNTRPPSAPPHSLKLVSFRFPALYQALSHACSPLNPYISDPHLAMRQASGLPRCPGQWAHVSDVDSPDVRPGPLCLSRSAALVPESARIGRGLGWTWALRGSGPGLYRICLTLWYCIESTDSCVYLPGAQSRHEGAGENVAIAVNALCPSLYYRYGPDVCLRAECSPCHAYVSL